MLRASRTLAERLKDRAAIDRALREGVRAAVLRHQKLGQSIVIWRDGKVVVVPPERIAEELAREEGNSGPTTN